jgi:voltage-gated anion channel
MLEFAAAAPAAQGSIVLREHRAALELVRASLRERQTPYADVLEAVCVSVGEISAADRARAVKLAASGPPQSVGMGDHWVTGGALAISTVAAGRITLAAQRTGAPSGALGALKTISLVLWCLTMAWLPALVIYEALRPRLRYNVRRWSTVFPVGMYAACSFIVGTVTQTAGITDFARVWVWVALAVWLVVFAAMLRRAPSLAQGEP